MSPAGWFPRWKPSLSSDEDHVFAHYEDRVKEGTVIKVQDVAFITYVRLRRLFHAAPNQQTSTGSKRFFSTYIQATSSSRPLGRKPTVEPGPLKLPPSRQTVYPDLHRSPSIGLQIRCLPSSHYATFPPHHSCLVRRSSTQVYCFGKNQRRVGEMRCRPRILQQIYFSVCPMIGDVTAS